MPVLVLSKTWFVVVAAMAAAVGMYALSHLEPRITVVAPVIVQAAPPATAAQAPGRVTCADPLTGTWIGRLHHPGYEDWHEISLTIGRTPYQTNGLRGQIRARIWSGDWSQERPALCNDGSPDQKVVVMAARGTVQGEIVSFAGTIIESATVTCGFGSTEYGLDSFTGAVDEVTGRLEVVNNDGGRAVDRPWSFERVACAD